MARINFLGVIPARGGSKGVPRKSVKMIAGKPLIAWTIAAAKAARHLDHLIVSTEDAEIAQVSLRFGAEVLDRPKELASDTATSWSVLDHVLSKIDAEHIVLLEPTSPVRDKGIIDECIERFQKGKFDNLATGFMCTYSEYATTTKRRQDMKGFFYNVGVAYVIKSGLIKKGKMFGRRIGRVMVDREQQVEIDEPFDFWMAEQILLKRIREGRQ